MNSSAFNLGEDLNKKIVEFSLSRETWFKFELPDLGVDISFPKWQSIKYLNHNGNALNDDTNNIPNDSGGLYLFYVNCQILPIMTCFPFYIGRAKHTENQNLRKRIKSYHQNYINSTERPKITRMLNYWKEDLFVAYITINSNEHIDQLEEYLINSLVLPMNDVIPDIEIRQAIKAFS